MAGRFAPMPTALDTARLTLRARTDADVDWNLELLAERGDGVVRSRAEVETRMAAQAVDAVHFGFGFLTIRLRPTGEAIGYCGLLVGRASVEEPEIAYELLRRHHGHGYATEAAAAVLGAAFGTGRTRIWSTVRAWNVPSLRVLAKLGFIRDRVETDDRGELVYLSATADGRHRTTPSGV